MQLQQNQRKSVNGQTFLLKIFSHIKLCKEFQLKKMIGMSTHGVCCSARKG